MPPMSSTVARADFVRSTSRPIAFWPVACALFFFALLWFQVVHHLKAEWNANPQYAYGWVVPFVALFLIWKRWPDRPAPDPPLSRGWAVFLAFVFALLYDCPELDRHSS